MHILAVAIPAVCLAVSFLVWFIAGRDSRVRAELSATPPDGINPVDTYFMLDNGSLVSHMSSLLFHLANKGYLQIFPTTHGSNPVGMGVGVRKLKDYDGRNFEEYMFMHGLFTKNIHYSHVDLSAQFYHGRGSHMLQADIAQMPREMYPETPGVLLRTLSMVVGYKQKNPNPALEKANSAGMKFLFILKLFAMMSIMVIPLTGIGSGYMSVPIVVLVCMVFTSFFPGLLKGKSNIYMRLAMLAALSGVIVLTFALTGWAERLMYSEVYLYPVIIGLLCVVGISILRALLPKKTDKGNEVYAKQKGLEEFIKTATTPALRSQMQVNKYYFYDIYPYAYVLGLSDIWTEKFREIEVPIPHWYEGDLPYCATNGVSLAMTVQSILAFDVHSQNQDFETQPSF